MAGLNLSPISVFPWGLAAKYAGIIGAGVLLLTVGYVKGDGDRNSKWLKKENLRISAEADARLKAIQKAHELNIKSATDAADALARADEKAQAASQRAENAEKSRNATRRQNNALFANLKDAQSAAASAGDLAGRALMPSGVRDQTANRLERICSRRPSECGAKATAGSKIQENTGVADPNEDLAGGYPGNSQ